MEDSVKQRNREIYRVTLLGSAVNAVLLLAKFVAGIVGHSAAMIADAVHSLSDFLTDIIVLLFVRISGKPKDKSHDYGHGKYETLAMTLIGLSLLAVAAGIVYSGGVKIVAWAGGSRLQAPGMLALWAALLSIVLKEALSRYSMLKARQLNSQAVEANAWHHRSDALSSVGTALGIGGAIFLGERWAVLDPIASVIVGLFVVKVAVRLLLGGIGDLMEQSLPDDVEQDILALAASVPGVTKPHALRTRRIGNHYAIEMHIVMDGDITLRQAHDRASQVEDLLREHYGRETHVAVHVEPLSPPLVPRGGASGGFKVLLFLLLTSPFSLLPSFAQYNTDRLVTIGRSALFYEDYVLSMQYFNQAIQAKPYLYEPWFFRGVAKYYLEDYAGAERDCSEALQRNPYVVNIYELRGLTRIQQKKYAEAIEDYTRALRYDPENRGLWHNRVLCRIQNKDYDTALLELDTIQARWSQYATAWAVRADVYMHQEDTVRAVDALQKSLDIDPYDGQTWAARSIISLSREEWPEAEEQLNHAIHLLPKRGGYYINRALARFHQNNLRGAMADYDMALDLEPNNFLGHYNRGLLRAQVGDDNRAITDFDFVLRLEPDNMLALFNRAVLLDKTGDLHGAIRDYSKVIDEFPNFWTGLEFRAACYRRLGMTKKAEQDEFTVYRARLYKHLYGTQPRLDPDKMRKRSDEDLEKYNQLVVEDQQEQEHEYKNDYRGRVQNRRVALELQPMFALSLEKPHDEVRANIAFDRDVDALNQRLQTEDDKSSNRTPSYARVNTNERKSDVNKSSNSKSHRQVYVTCGQTVNRQIVNSQTVIDSLTAAINQTHDTRRAVENLLVRAIAYSVIQDNQQAIDDLSTFISLCKDSASADSTSSSLLLALWQRAVCQARISLFQASEGANTELTTASVLADLNHALELRPHNAYLLYNRGCIHARRENIRQAIDDFTAALQQEPNMAEAYFNRGICYHNSGEKEKASADLSKAGELGLYDAYSLLKREGSK